MTAGRVLACAATLAAAGCGDSPTEPSRVPPAYSLRAGNYTLTIAAAASSATTSNPCTVATTAAARAAIPVTVEEVATTWRIRPTADADLGLAATLTSSMQNLLTGPVEGQARDIGSGVVVTVSAIPPIPPFSPGGPSTLLGSLEGENLGSGLVNGEVRFSLGNGVRTCAVNNWRLEPR